MKKAKIVDFYGVKNFHEMFDTSFLLMCERIFDQVEYVSSSSSQENINNLLKTKGINISSKISFRRLYVSNSYSAIAFLSRMICGFFIVLKEFLCSDKNSSIFYIYSNPLAFIPLQVLNRYVQKNVYVVSHGELSFFQRNDLKKTRPWYWYAKLWYYGFSRSNTKMHLKYIVLGESIKKNMIHLFPNLKDSLIVINHPYIFSSFQDKGQFVRKTKIVLGVIGFMTQEKGLYDLLDFAEQLKSKIFNQELEIKVIGRNPSLIDVKEYPFIGWSGDNVLSRKLFEEEIKKIDYLLYFYNPETYRLTASGALFDAISFGKPSIYLSNDYFKDAIGESPIGYGCDTVDDMVRKVDEIIQRGDMQYQSYVHNLDMLKDKFSIRYNAELLKQQIHH